MKSSLYPKKILIILGGLFVFPFHNLTPTINWKEHTDALETAAYNADTPVYKRCKELHRLKLENSPPQSRYLGFLWEIAHKTTEKRRNNLFKKISLLTFSHYAWNTLAFVSKKEKKRDWSKRRPAFITSCQKQNIDDEKNAKTLEYIHESFNRFTETYFKKPLAKPKSFNEFWEIMMQMCLPHPPIENVKKEASLTTSHLKLVYRPKLCQPSMEPLIKELRGVWIFHWDEGIETTLQKVE